MTKDRLKYLLDRYLGNSATPAELQEYNDWYEQQAGTVAEKPFEEKDHRQMFTEIIARINDHETEATEAKPVTRTRYMQYVKWAAAAMLAGAVFMLFNKTRSGQETAIAHTATVSNPVKPQMVTVVNNTAGEKLIRLKDGSLARLFAGSTLRYKAPFGANERKIYLEGKGSFDVTKDPANPFTVYSQHITTTALGTSFTVTAYTGKKELTVSLHTGRVVVKDLTAHNGNRKEIYLLPGQQVYCNIATGKASIRQITGGAEAAGTAGLAPGSRTGFAATFDQAPMDSVLDIISKGYGVNIKYDREKLSAMLFSGSIRDTDSLSQVLKRIEVLYNLSVKPTGKQFIIRKSH